MSPDFVRVVAGYAGLSFDPADAEALATQLGRLLPQLRGRRSRGYGNLAPAATNLPLPRDITQDERGDERE